MTAQEWKKLLNELTMDIDFEYCGKHGTINPFSLQDISLVYDGIETSVASVTENHGVKHFPTGFPAK